MLNREWLYTAITRAKKRLILLYNQRGLRQALQTQAIKGNTIYEKAEWFNKLAGDKFITTPYIPAPQKLI
jgi:superfamily I DNA/RNA helicase